MHWAAQESAARHALEYAAQAGDDRLRLNALRLLAGARVMQGDIEAGQALALLGLTEARSLGLRGVEARLLNTLSVAAGIRGDHMVCLDLDRQCLEIYREAGDRVAEANGLLNVGGSFLGLGDLTQARRELDAALPILQANGDRATESFALVNLSVLALWQADAARALVLARLALDIAVAAQARDIEVIAGLRLGDAELALSRLDAAREAYTQAQVRALEIDDPAQHDAIAGVARATLAEGDAVAGLAAIAALKPLLGHVDAGGTLKRTDDSRRIELTCHQVLARVGDSRADEWLVRAHDALMAQAEAITDATLRQGFLLNVPHHRDIVAAWAKRVATGPSSAPSAG